MMMKRTNPISYLQRLRAESSGVSTIEFAVIAPVMLLIVLGALEFGVYFIQYSHAQRAVTTISNAVQNHQLSQTDINKLAAAASNGMVDFTAEPNYLCANAYETLADARKFGCGGSKNWNTAQPSGLGPNDSYYVVMEASVDYQSLSSFVPFLPPMKASSLFMVSPLTTTNNNSLTFPKCDKPNQVLHSDSSGKITCYDRPLDPDKKCNALDEFLHFDGMKFICAKIPPGTHAGWCESGTIPGPSGSMPYNSSTFPAFTFPGVSYGPNGNCACGQGWTVLMTTPPHAVYSGYGMGSATGYTCVKD